MRNEKPASSSPEPGGPTSGGGALKRPDRGRRVWRFRMRGLRLALVMVGVVTLALGVWTAGYFWALGAAGGWIDRDNPPEIQADPSLLSIVKDLALGGTAELVRALSQGGTYLAEKADLKGKDPVDTHGYRPVTALVHVLDLTLPGVSLGEAERWVPHPAFAAHGDRAQLLRGALGALGWLLTLLLTAELVASSLAMRRPDS